MCPADLETSPAEATVGTRPATSPQMHLSRGQGLGAGGASFSHSDAGSASAVVCLVSSLGWTV